MQEQRESSWLTIPGIARRLGRAESTIRHWRTIYRPWIEERRDDAGQAVYPLGRFEEIAVLHGSRLTPREVRAELARRHAAGGDEPPPRGTADILEDILAALRQQTALLGAELRAIRALLERERDA